MSFGILEPAALKWSSLLTCLKSWLHALSRLAGHSRPLEYLRIQLQRLWAENWDFRFLPERKRIARASPSPVICVVASKEFHPSLSSSQLLMLCACVRFLSTVFNCMLYAVVSPLPSQGRSPLPFGFAEAPECLELLPRLRALMTRAQHWGSCLERSRESRRPNSVQGAALLSTKLRVLSVLLPQLQRRGCAAQEGVHQAAACIVEAIAALSSPRVFGCWTSFRPGPDFGAHLAGA